jgi:hypothetical protein
VAKPFFRNLLCHLLRPTDLLLGKKLPIGKVGTYTPPKGFGHPPEEYPKSFFWIR